MQYTVYGKNKTLAKCTDCFSPNMFGEKICISFTAYEKKYLQLRISCLSQRTGYLLLRSGPLK